MFDFKKDKKSLENITEKRDINSLEKTILLTKEPNFDTANIKVHTMPEKFLSGHSKKIMSTDLSAATGFSSNIGHKKNIIIGTVIGVLVIALMALGAWFLLKSLEQPKETTQPLIVEQNPTMNANTTSPENINSVDECSAENCGACTVSECQNFSATCHLTDACLINNSGMNTSACPNFICVSGIEEKQATSTEDINDINQEITLVVAKDSDNDMLSDLEEGLWGTNPLETDTDKDNYSDGQEVKNLYSPIVPGSENSAKLIGSKLVKEFVNDKFGYIVYYPATWTVEDLKKNSEEVIFKAQNEEFVEIIVSDLEENYDSAKEWYLSQDNNMQEEDLEEVLIGNWSGLKSLDGLSVYLIRNNKLYTLTYNVGLNTELTYQTTFEMMFKIFKFFESPLN
ncbi:MAG TPA: hypothetical protein PLK76_02480 [bacterium]|nr:hypothetical protein [bacterium]